MDYIEIVFLLHPREIFADLLIAHFSEMGFEKAGEGYFSPDGNTIIFQAVPTGQKNYQIYTMDLNTMVPHMVSTGKGACTCANFHPDNQKIICGNHKKII